MLAQAAIRRAAAVSKRAYSVIPRTPQAHTPAPEQPTAAAAATANATVASAQPGQDSHNPIHALYNNENQSILQHHQHDEDLGSHHILSGADAFSPTFNTVFDE